MALFLSTHTNKVDAKGRVSVPAGFRATLAEQAFPGVVLIPSNKFAALEGFDMGMIQEISTRLDKFDLFSDTQDDLAATIFANATPLGFDDTGRIGIPKELLAHANITDNAVFVGLGTKFQIWEPGAFAARKEQAAAQVQSKGLTIPNLKAPQ
ncbi:MAG: mraZ family protein [Alphaproteobacteria bacterium]|nr:mraZ family protein [Alphaproteobacteria bacterium]